MKGPWLPVLLISTLVLGSCSSGGGGGDDDDEPPVTVDLNVSTATVEVGATFQFFCTVNHASDNSVVWKVNDVTGGNAAVGTISTSGLYTAPAVLPSPNPVTVKAVSNADPTKSDTAAVTVAAPTSLTVSPAAVTVAAGATQAFVSSSGAAWEVIGPAGTDAATWGTIDATGLYHAPALPPWLGQVTVKATSLADATKTATATVTVVFSNATLNGHYVFRYRSADAPSAGFTGRLWAVGSFEADGNGAITAGTADFVSFADAGNAALTLTFTGTYGVGPDGRATAEFILQTTGTPVLPMRWVFNSDVSARIVAFDDTGSGWGNIDRQDPASFAAGLDGTYVFMYDGLTSPQRPVSAAGMFDTSAGAISAGVIDINDNGAVTAEAAMTGLCSGIDASSGRGTWAVTIGGVDHHFVFYAMSAASLAFGSASGDRGILGSAVRQDKSAPYSRSSLAGDVVFVSTGYVPVSPGEGIPAVSAGRFTADGQGNMTAGVVDSIAAGTGAVNAAASGTYDVAANGHGTMALTAAGGTNNLSFYLYAARQGFYVSRMAGVSATGQFLPQASGGFDAAGLRSAFALGTRGTFVAAGQDQCGRMTLDGSGALTGTVDTNYAGVLSPGAVLTGTYTMAANGRGETTLNVGAASTRYAIYAFNRRMLFLVPIGAGAPTAVGYAYRQY